MEDKEYILYKLFETLVETHEFCCDLRGLELVSDGDTVLAHFTNGSTTRINVACDSGIAMISDVIKALRRR